MTDLKIGVVKFGPPAEGEEAKKTTSTWGQAETPAPAPQPPPTDREKHIFEAIQHMRKAQQILSPHHLDTDADVIGAHDEMEKAIVQLVRAREAHDHEPARVTIWPQESDRKPRHYDLREVPDEDGSYAVEGLEEI